MKIINLKFKRLHLVLFLIIFLSSFNVYSQILYNGPVYDDIQSWLGDHFNNNYRIAKIYKMQGIIESGISYPTPHQLFDPYGTLQHNYLFITKGKSQPDNVIPKGFWGVYHEGQIIWVSNAVIYTDHNASLELFATADLNNDGKVEVMIQSSIPGNVAGAQWLWIFSWDGMTGNFITEVDSVGQSTIVSQTNVADFEFADVSADGIWEIQGTWEDETGEGERLITYGWNGQLYGKWPGIPQPDEDAFLPRDAVDVKVQAIVTSNDSTFLYTYKLENKPTSIQDINEFNIDRKIDSVRIVSSRKRWEFFINGDLYRWKDFHGITFRHKTNFLTKGEATSDFKFESKGLPVISKYYVRGYNKIPLSQDIPLSTVYNDIFQNSVSGYTVVPSTLPDSINAYDFLDSLIYYNQMSDSLDWITDSAATAKYTSYFENAKFYIHQNNHPAASNVLDSVLTDVEADSGVTLTSEAYALIKYNTEYLKKFLERE